MLLYWFIMCTKCSLVILVYLVLSNVQIFVICKLLPSVSVVDTVDSVQAAVVGPESFIGYYPASSTSTIRNWLNFSMLSNTATLCFKMCGYLDALYAILWYEQCICSGDVDMADLSPGNCSKQYVCPGNNSELCGCVNDLTVYQIDYSTIYSVIIVDDANLYPAGEYYVTLFGETRDCEEYLMSSNTANNTLPCRNVGDILGIRIGLGKLNGSSVITQIYVKANGLTKFSSNCGSVALGGNSSNVIDLLSNSSCVPSKDSSRYFSGYTSEIIPFQFAICSAENYPCEGDRLNSATWPPYYYLQIMGVYFYQEIRTNYFHFSYSAVGTLAAKVKYVVWSKPPETGVVTNCEYTLHIYGFIYIYYEIFVTGNCCTFMFTQSSYVNELMSL